jgi:hypothetical protein
VRCDMFVVPIKATCAFVERTATHTRWCCGSTDGRNAWPHAQTTSSCESAFALKEGADEDVCASSSSLYKPRSTSK